MAATWEEFQFHFSTCVAVWAIVASLGVLCVSSRSFWRAEAVEKALRVPLRFVSTNRFYNLVVLLSSLVLCVAYVVGIGAQGGGYMYVEVSACVVQILEMAIVLVHAAAMSAENVVEVVITRLAIDCFLPVSVLMRRFVYSDSSFSFAYVASLRFLQHWRNVQAVWNFKFMHGFAFQVLHTIPGIVVPVYFLSSAILQIETLDGEEWDILGVRGTGFADTGKIAMWDAGYLTLVTLTTVRYDDIRPTSFLGKLFMLYVAGKGMYLLANAILGVARAKIAGVAGGGRYAGSRTSRHVVVTGSLNFQVLATFLTEFYHEDHGKEIEDLVVVVLLNPDQRRLMGSMRRWLRRPDVSSRIQHNVVLIHGSALSHRDLHRAQLHDAVMAFVVGNYFVKDREREDLENAMRALSMRRYSPFLRIVALLLEAKHRDLMIGAGLSKHDLVCMDEFKFKVLGKACEVPGFVPVANAVLRSCTGTEMEGDDVLNWLEDYSLGLQNEYHEVDLSVAYNGAPYAEVAIDILARSKGSAFLVGLIEEPLYPGEEGAQFLFPGRSYRIGLDEDRQSKGLFIATDAAHIKQHPPETNFSYRLDESMLAAFNSLGAGSPKAQQQPTLPNAVPQEEQVDELGAHHWVVPPVVVAIKREALAHRGMKALALQRAAKGIQGAQVLPREKIIELFGEDAIKSGGSTALAQDLLAKASDPAERALMQQVVRALQQDDDDSSAEEARRRAEEENHTDARVSRLVGWAQEVITQREAMEQMSQIELSRDNLLWCGAQPQPKKLWGSPKEPPDTLTVKGGHVLVLVLEHSVLGQTTAAASSSPGIDSRIGPPLCLGSFLDSLSSTCKDGRGVRRPVVVVASRVPVDWPEFAPVGNVFFVLGRPLSTNVLHRAGVQQSHAVVIHQHDISEVSDLASVDAEAIFACKLVDALLADVGRDIPVICNLILDRSAEICPLTTFDGPKVTLEDADDYDEKVKDTDQAAEEVHMQPRFAAGQQLVESIPVAVLANLMYKRSLAVFIQELFRSGYIVVPVPDAWQGKTFKELWDFMVRQRNLLPIALVRRTDLKFEEIDEDDAEDPIAIAKAQAAAMEPKKRWSRAEGFSKHYTTAMPHGNRAIREKDGILCILPGDGRPQLPV